MSTQLHPQATALLGQALDLPPDQRAAFLARACADEPVLHALVTSLLSRVDQLDDFLEAPLLRADVQPGDTFGHWRVLRELGRGGMGVVLLVERSDGAVDQQAALKVVQQHALGPQARARFQRERQILASFTHADIARLIDAGSADDGRPYFVMELADGAPIHVYCAAQHLTLQQRVQLFARVCRAVHYAHQHLVLHRDLKPANIVVSSDGTLKLLDFGIASALGDEGDGDSEHANWPLTPHYASPEQLAGQPLSVASDLYALGLILYRLLTGQSPFGSATDAQARPTPTRPSDAIAQAAAIAQNADIARAGAHAHPGENEQTAAMAQAGAHANPGTNAHAAALHAGAVPALASDAVLQPGRKLARQLRGDLDNILLKALQRDPALRYASAAEFDSDLQRYLQHQPVLAAPPSLRYRTAKLLRRHPLAIAASGVAVAALVVGAGVATWQAREARAARLVAEQRFDQTRQLARTMLFDVNDALEKGPTAAREKLVATALLYLQQLAGDGTLQPELRRDVASAYERIGDIAGNQVGANLGRTKEAEAHYLAALKLREAAVLPGQPVALDDLVGLREVHRRLADIAWGQGRVEEARQHHEVAIDAARRAAALSGTPADALELLSRQRYGAAILYTRGQPSVGDLPQALKRFGELETALQAFMKAHPDNADAVKVYVPVLSQLVDLQRVTGQLDGALKTARLSETLAEQKVQATPDDARWVRQLSVTERQIGDILIEQGHNADGLAAIKKGLALRESVAAKDPSNERAARDVAIGYSAIADAMIATRDYAAAEAAFTRARDTFDTQAQKNPANAGLRAGVIDLELARANAQYLQGKLPAARQSLKALRARVQASAPKPGEGEVLAARLDLLDAQLGDAGQQDFAKAEQALVVLLKESETDPLDTYQQRASAQAWQQVGTVGLRGGQTVAACRYLNLAEQRYATLDQAKRLNALDQAARATLATQRQRCKKP